MLTAALFIMAKNQKQYSCPSMGEWLKAVHLHHGILFVNKKNKLLIQTAKLMDLKGIKMCGKS